MNPRLNETSSSQAEGASSSRPIARKCPELTHQQMGELDVLCTDEGKSPGARFSASACEKGKRKALPGSVEAIEKKKSKKEQQQETQLQETQPQETQQQQTQPQETQQQQTQPQETQQQQTQLQETLVPDTQLEPEATDEEANGAEGDVAAGVVKERKEKKEKKNKDKKDKKERKEKKEHKTEKKDKKHKKSKKDTREADNVEGADNVEEADKRMCQLVETLQLFQDEVENPEDDAATVHYEGEGDGNEVEAEGAIQDKDWDDNWDSWWASEEEIYKEWQAWQHDKQLQQQEGDRESGQEDGESKADWCLRAFCPPLKTW